MRHHNPMKGKFLIVEDEPGDNELIRDFLRNHGFDYEIAKNGIEAEKLLEKEALCLNY